MIQLNNVSKTFFDGERELKVLDIPKLQFQDEKSYFLKGESGTGKSTLFNIMSGLLRADSGEVLYDGEDVAQMDENQRDRFRALQVGYVFQGFNLFKGFSALENVAIPLNFAGQKRSRAQTEEIAMQLLDAVGLSGMESKRVERMSGGQQQRVAIARALVNDPAVILADEPTGNLDRRNGERVLDLLLKLSKERQMILIVVSHDLSLSDRFDTVLDICDFNRAAIGGEQ